MGLFWMQKFNRLVDKLVCLECRYPAACANYDQLQISLVRHQSERMNGKIDLGCGGWGYMLVELHVVLAWDQSWINESSAVNFDLGVRAQTHHESVLEELYAS